MTTSFQKTLGILFLGLLLLSGCTSADTSGDEDSGDETTSYLWYKLDGNLKWENANNKSIFIGEGTLEADLYFKKDKTTDTHTLDYYYITSQLNSYGGSDGICTLTPSSTIPLSIANFPYLSTNTVLHTDINRLQFSIDSNQSLNGLTVSSFLTCLGSQTSSPITDYPFYKLLGGLKIEDIVFDIQSGLSNKTVSYELSDASGTFYETMDFVVTYLGETTTTDKSLGGEIESLPTPISLTTK